jgi:hypothetical protein
MAGHAKVDDECPVIEFNQEILAASRRSPYGPAGKALRQVDRERPAQTASSQGDSGDYPTVQKWRDTASGNFNFG